MCVKTKRFILFLICSTKSTDWDKMALEVGINYTHVYHILKGRQSVSLNMLEKLVLFGMSADWYFTGEGEMTRVCRD